MINAEETFESFKRSLSDSESEYAEDCWTVFKMAVEFNTLYTIDLEEELPRLPFNISIKQGYMIRQTLFDIALDLNEETKSRL